MCDYGMIKNGNKGPFSISSTNVAQSNPLDMVATLEIEFQYYLKQLMTLVLRQCEGQNQTQCVRAQASSTIKKFIFNIQMGVVLDFNNDII